MSATEFWRSPKRKRAETDIGPFVKSVTSLPAATGSDLGKNRRLSERSRARRASVPYAVAVRRSQQTEKD